MACAALRTFLQLYELIFKDKCTKPTNDSHDNRPNPVIRRASWRLFPRNKRRDDCIDCVRDPSLDPVLIAIFLERRQERAINHARRRTIPIPSVAATKFNPHGAVGFHNKNQNTVIAGLVANASLVEKVRREFLKSDVGGEHILARQGENGPFNARVFL